jgi:hypothetical protein
MRGESIIKSAVVVLLWGLAVNVSTAKYSGGTGEPHDPYRIATANDLNDIGNHTEDLGSHFVMLNDVNLAAYTGTQFNIIGDFVGYGSPDNRPFAGVFDGNGHTVSNFSYASTDADYTGLFGYIYGAHAKVTDLGLVDPNIDGGTGWTVGLLAGWLRDGTITNCYADNGNISGSGDIGGLVGRSKGILKDSYTTGKVSGDNRVGGLVGDSDGPILNCYSITSVEAVDFRIGGLVGDNGDTISNCYSSGTVTGATSVGGLVGHNHYGAISNCYSTDLVTGNDTVGGLAGDNYGGEISNSYSTGSASGTMVIGGFVGGNAVGGDIFDCYSVGSVSGTTDIGGFAGYNGDEEESQATIVHSFWDSDINPDVNGIGNTNDPNVIGKTTAEMQTESTFTNAGWDFVEVWDIGENQTYPFLRRHLPGDMNHDGIVDWRDLAILAGRWLQEAGE